MRRVLDLFSGAAGGWSAGVERAGWRTVAACEIDPWRRAVFAAQHPGAVMYEDVRDVTAARLLADLGYLPDIVVGSPPCQDLSAANSRGGGIGGARSGLFWEWLRVVDEVRPDWACAENSPRLRTLGYDDIAAGLEAIGYACWPAVVGAADAGAPHLRRRVWIVARHPDGGDEDAVGDALPRAGADATGIAPDADGDRWRQPRGRGVRGELSDAGDGRAGAPPDAEGDGLRRGTDAPTPRRARAEPDESRAPPDADALRQPQPGRRLGDQRRRDRDQALRHAADADRPGHAIGSRFPGDDGEELPPALRDIGRAWSHWNGGLSGLAASCAAAGAGAVDDGGVARIPPGLRNRAIAALGDAVVPQITEAIARAIDRTDAVMRETA